MAVRYTPKVGQTMFRVNCGNNAIRRDIIIEPVNVTRVGRKYFYIRPKGGNKWQEVTFIIEDWSQKTDYCADWILYDTEQEWIDEQRKSELCAIFSSLFEYNRSKLPLEKIEQMYAIVEGAND
jgi:hypothetical protein